MHCARHGMWHDPRGSPRRRGSTVVHPRRAGHEEGRERLRRRPGDRSSENRVRRPGGRRIWCRQIRPGIAEDQRHPPCVVAAGLLAAEFRVQAEDMSRPGRRSVTLGEECCGLRQWARQAGAVEVNRPVSHAVETPRAGRPGN